MKNLFIVFILGVIISGCSRPDTYPIIPALEFKSLQIVGSADTGFSIKKFILTTTFTDGDGDIGYYLDRPNEAIFDDSTSDYYYNYVISMQVQKNGIWKDTVITYEFIETNSDTTEADNDTITIYYNDLASARIPYLTQEGQNKGLKGDIDKTSYLPLLVGDTIRFRAFIYDRSLHKSNEIITPGYYVRNP